MPIEVVEVQIPAPIAVIEVSMPAPIAVVEVQVPGIQGPGGSGSAYVHTQAVASAEWIINHNFGFRPSVELHTTGGSEFDAEVNHPTVNQTRVITTTPMTGTARCN